MTRRLMRLARRWLLAFLGSRPGIGLFYLPKYIGSWFAFRAKASGPERPRLRDAYPCLTDWTTYTPFDPHYFYQGAWLARRLQAARPSLHVDVGSSVLTVGTVSAVVNTIFVDYRPVKTKLEGMNVVAGNILTLPFPTNSAASVSCLHVIEHIGLGRYGDPIDPNGATKAARELARILCPGGRLYISVPVGRERVEFNAHRVFSPISLRQCFEDLDLVEFSHVDDHGRFSEHGQLEDAGDNEYACGLYVFEKRGHSVSRQQASDGHEVQGE